MVHETDTQKRQYRLSIYLKVVDVLLLLLYIVFFFTCSWYAKSSDSILATSIESFGGFRIVTSILVIAILGFFWNVATQIGRGNSFSMENVLHFRNMGYCGILLAISYVFRIIYLVLTDALTTFRGGYCVALIVFGGLFATVCFILSALIQNAYDLKQENDLTI